MTVRLKYPSIFVPCRCYHFQFPIEQIFVPAIINTILEEHSMATKAQISVSVDYFQQFRKDKKIQSMTIGKK